QSPAHRQLHCFPTRRSSDLRRFIGSPSARSRQRQASAALPHGRGRLGFPVSADFHAANQPNRIGGWAAQRAYSRKVTEPSFNLRDRKSTRLNSSHQIISYAV